MRKWFETFTTMLLFIGAIVVFVFVLTVLAYQGSTSYVAGNYVSAMLYAVALLFALAAGFTTLTES